MFAFTNAILKIAGSHKTLTDVRGHPLVQNIDRPGGEYNCESRTPANAPVVELESF